MQLPPFTIHTFDVLDSTNRELKRNAFKYKAFDVVWAFEQQSGRGRFDRTWQSSSGDDLTFSIFLPLTSLSQNMWPVITQVAALAIHNTLRENNLPSVIKWPNDILIDGRKVCGILCELTQKENEMMAILGIGINVNSNCDLLSKIDRPATSLTLYQNTHFDLKQLLSSILVEFDSLFNYLQVNGFEQLRNKIWENLTFRGEHIIIVDGETTHSGTIMNINADGTLLFKCEECGVISLNSGEISFRNTENNF